MIERDTQYTDEPVCPYCGYTTAPAGVENAGQKHSED